MLCPEEMATLVTAQSILIAQGRSIEELNILSAIFTQIGDTLATIAIQKSNLSLCREKCQSCLENRGEQTQTQQNNAAVDEHPIV